MNILFHGLLYLKLWLDSASVYLGPYLRILTLCISSSFFENLFVHTVSMISSATIAILEMVRDTNWVKSKKTRTQENLLKFIFFGS